MIVALRIVLIAGLVLISREVPLSYAGEEENEPLIEQIQPDDTENPENEEEELEESELND